MSPPSARGASNSHLGQQPPGRVNAISPPSARGASNSHLGRLELLRSYRQQPQLSLPEWRAEQERRLARLSAEFGRDFSLGEVLAKTQQAMLKFRLWIGQVLAAAWQAIEWLGSVLSMLRELAKALRVAIKSVADLCQVKPSARANASLVNPVSELDRFGRKISNYLPAAVARRYFDPYLQERKCDLNDEIANHKGSDGAAFVLQRLRRAKICIALAGLDSLRLAATNWVLGGMRRS